MSNDPPAEPGKYYTLEYINDSGAGRNIASLRALKEQGIPNRFLDNIKQPASQCVQFDTGGGLKTCDTSIGIGSLLLGKSSELYCLSDCPTAMCQGMIVNTRRMPYIWQPGCLPWHCTDISKLKIFCPEKFRFYADRVEDNVPIFKELVYFHNHSSANAAPNFLAIPGPVVPEFQELPDEDFDPTSVPDLDVEPRATSQEDIPPPPAPYVSPMRTSKSRLSLTFP